MPRNVHFAAAGQGAAGEGGGGGGGGDGGNGGGSGPPGNGVEDLRKEDERALRSAVSMGLRAFLIFLFFNGLYRQHPPGYLYNTYLPEDLPEDYVSSVIAMMSTGSNYLFTPEWYQRKVVLGRDLLEAEFKRQRDLNRDIFSRENRGRSLVTNNSGQALNALPESTRADLAAGRAGWIPPGARRDAEGIAAVPIKREDTGDGKDSEALRSRKRKSVGEGGGGGGTKKAIRWFSNTDEALAYINVMINPQTVYIVQALTEIQRQFNNIGLPFNEDDDLSDVIQIYQRMVDDQRWRVDTFQIIFTAIRDNLRAWIDKNESEKKRQAKTPGINEDSGP